MVDDMMCWREDEDAERGSYNVAKQAGASVGRFTRDSCARGFMRLTFQRRRMNFTMEKMLKMTEAEYTIFMRVLFGLSSPSPVPEDLSSDPEFGKIEWIDPTLNDSQKDAIRFALASREIALIHGPPGVSQPVPPPSPPLSVIAMLPASKLMTTTRQERRTRSSSSS